MERIPRPPLLSLFAARGGRQRAGARRAARARAPAQSDSERARRVYQPACGARTLLKFSFLPFPPLALFSPLRGSTTTVFLPNLHAFSWRLIFARKLAATLMLFSSRLPPVFPPLNTSSPF